MTLARRVGRLEDATFTAALARFRRRADAHDGSAMLRGLCGTATPTLDQIERWFAAQPPDTRPMVERLEYGLPLLWDASSSPRAVRDALAHLAPLLELLPAVEPLAVLVRLDAVLYGGGPEAGLPQRTP